ncbi:hypothetical protein BDB00DRAFT_544871 [Zychaea mexicana]|uniref:uncharacterized protein n=1 Tax=Zychaea mexicana TaxID=64656 RepID=UPI0022FDB70B|nr:uncharacterized protein BDB00DRAFT_544871 [Zychaea mexicana]KAI9497894.1 hypothetical protein BDB00DRAFT_544871 [Zychaea mexicana]
MVVLRRVRRVARNSLVDKEKTIASFLLYPHTLSCLFSLIPHTHWHKAHYPHILQHIIHTHTHTYSHPTSLNPPKESPLPYLLLTTAFIPCITKNILHPLCFSSKYYSLQVCNNQPKGVKDPVHTDSPNVVSILRDSFILVVVLDAPVSMLVEAT